MTSPICKPHKLSEKTLELNFCSQFAALVQCEALWLGLTQLQESKFGFDASTTLKERVFVFQFKAPKNGLKPSEFKLDDRQLRVLMKATKHKRSVFYALSMIGVSDELRHKQRVPEHTWLLDIIDIPPNLPVPDGNRPSHHAVIDTSKPGGPIVRIATKHKRKRSTISISITLATTLIRELEDDWEQPSVEVALTGETLKEQSQWNNAYFNQQSSTPIGGYFF
jgi:hypothetical protein